MNQSEFRHNYFNKIQMLLKQRDELNKKIEIEISRISFIALTELPEPPEDSILVRAERG